MIIVFIYGLTVGAYKVFPYEFLDSTKDGFDSNDQIIQNPSLSKFDPNSIINIKNESDII